MNLTRLEGRPIRQGFGRGRIDRFVVSLTHNETGYDSLISCKHIPQDSA